jgi:hypothetical protein
VCAWIILTAKIICTDRSGYLDLAKAALLMQSHPAAFGRDSTDPRKRTRKDKKENEKNGV